jgi:hypothetical protein
VGAHFEDDPFPPNQSDPVEVSPHDHDIGGFVLQYQRLQFRLLCEVSVKESQNIGERIPKKRGGKRSVSLPAFESDTRLQLVLIEKLPG